MAQTEKSEQPSAPLSKEAIIINMDKRLKDIESRRVEIQIMRVTDAALPSVSDDVYKNSVEFIRNMLKKKFGFDITLSDMGNETFETYFGALPEEKIKGCEDAYWNFVDGITNSPDERKKQIAEYAEDYKKNRTLDELKGLFPKEERDSIASYEDAVDRAFIHWTAMVEQYKNANVNGAPVVDKEHSYKNLLVCWKRLRKDAILKTKQKPDAFVITNVPVLADPDIVHSLTGTSTVGGTAQFASTFPYKYELDFIKPYVNEKVLSDDDYLYVFALKVAHELGHRIFGVRDYLDKKYGSCLMYGGARKYGKQTAKEVYEAMLAEEPCPGEKKAAENLTSLMQAEALTYKKKYEEAFTLLSGMKSIKAVIDYDSNMYLLTVWNAIKLEKVEEAKTAAKKLKDLNKKNCGKECSYKTEFLYAAMENDLSPVGKEFLECLNVP